MVYKKLYSQISSKIISNKGKTILKNKTARALSSGTCQARLPERIIKNGNKKINWNKETGREKKLSHTSLQYFPKYI